MPEIQNQALWLHTGAPRFRIAPAPYTRPGADELVVRVHAIAVNPVDAMPGLAYRLVVPWLSFPAVIGSDVAGEVVEVGAAVTHVRVGDRVIGHAIGLERSRNRAAEGAFQHYAVLVRQLVSAIPDSLPFEQAAVLPLTLSTAATGLFQRDHLGLGLPSAAAPERVETVLVWGGSTSVGSNAIQLARNAGYRVIATASPHNFGYVESLGASAVVDYRSRAAVSEILEAIGDSALAGTLAIGAGSLVRAVAIAARAQGSGRVASTRTAMGVRLRSVRARHPGVRVSGIWGGTLKDNEVGPAIYVDFLSAALASGAYRAAPNAAVVGKGLESIPGALQRLRAGVSATKLVVTL